MKRRTTPAPEPRKLAGIILAPLLVALALAACAATPDTALWPPQPGQTTQRLDIAITGRHAILVETLPGASADAPTIFREWEFAARPWYLEGRRGFREGARSLFLFPPPGIGKSDFSRPPWERHPEEPYRHWRVELSPEGYRRLVALLERDRGDPVEGYEGWYVSRRDYSLFHNCNHFAADALRAAGLPIRPWWTFTGGSLERQLSHAEEISPDHVERLE